jgi:hypothetical protein
VHRQRQGTRTLRIWLQSVGCHPGDQAQGGQFVLHAKALHGNPFDGHTLGPVVTELEQLTGVETRRIHVDKGYRGHNHRHKFRVWITGQVRRVTQSIRREMKRRAAVEPVIGHLKAEPRMGRNYLKGRPFDKLRRRPRQRRARRCRLQLVWGYSGQVVILRLVCLPYCDGASPSRARPVSDQRQNLPLGAKSARHKLVYGGPLWSQP